MQKFQKCSCVVTSEFILCKQKTAASIFAAVCLGCMVSVGAGQGLYRGSGQEQAQMLSRFVRLSR